MKFLDTLLNLVSGLGTSAKDKSVSSTFVQTFVDPAELEAMYRSDWLSRKVVDIIPNDMTREWREWKAKKSEIEKIEELENGLNVQQKLNLAMRKARLTGGSAIYLGMKDRQPAAELVLDKVKAGDLEYIHVLSKTEIAPGTITRDVLSPYFGEPEQYSVASALGNVQVIHPSRVIRFVGAEIIGDNPAVDGWGDSILQVVYDAIRNASSSSAHTAALIPEAKTDVIYIPRLSEYLKNAKTTAELTARFTYANSIKSMFNMLLLEGNGTDQGEVWQQKSIAFDQLPELVRLFLQIAAGAADIPVTRLLGESPAGLSATGESDIRNYYDNVSARQRTELSPRVHRLDEVLIRSALGNRPAEIHYEWAPLWGLSEKEKADVLKTTADAARAIVGASTGEIIPVEAVSDALVNALVEMGVLPGIEDAIEEYGRLSEQEESEEDLTAALIPPADPAAQLEAADAAPRSLYVRRDVINKAELARWAKSQGIDMVDDPHVTIIYSRSYVDWMSIRRSWSSKIEIEGGPRLMDLFSPTSDTLVLLIPRDYELTGRNREFREEYGASTDYDEYNPHITIVNGFTGKLEDVEPYQGKIILGPEIFEEVKP